MFFLPYTPGFWKIVVARLSCCSIFSSLGRNAFVWSVTIMWELKDIFKAYCSHGNHLPLTPQKTQNCRNRFRLVWFQIAMYLKDGSRHGLKYALIGERTKDT